MNILIKDQLHIFLLAVAFGVALTFIYDIVRVFRRIISHNKFAITIEDILYWVIAAFLIFYYVYETTSGKVRGFIFIGISIGIILYINLLSEFFVVNLSKIIQTIIRYLKKIILFLLKPLSFVLKPFFFFIKNQIKVLKKSKKCLIIRIKRLLKEIEFMIRKV